MEILRAIAQNALVALPGFRQLASARHVTGIEGDPRRAAELFEFYRGHGEVVGRDILELGTGRTLAVLSLAREAGAASVAAADVTRYHSDEAARRDGIDYRIYDGRRLPFGDASVDLVWACYCLQHFRWPECSVKEIARVLRPGGRLVCRMDLRDHYHMFVPGRQYDCLKHSERLWKLMAWNRGSYVNRLRCSDWQRLFAASGLGQVHMDKHRDEEILRQNREHAYLRRVTDDDLLTYRFDAVLERPGEGAGVEEAQSAAGGVPETLVALSFAGSLIV